MTMMSEGQTRIKFEISPRYKPAAQWFLRAIAECFARLSHRLSVPRSVCLSVRPSHPGTVSKRCKLKSQNLHHGLLQRL